MSSIFFSFFLTQACHARPPRLSFTEPPSIRVGRHSLTCP
jgi:hypothetical protein